jgi:hypothetical protein
MNNIFFKDGFVQARNTHHAHERTGNTVAGAVSRTDIKELIRVTIGLVGLGVIKISAYNVLGLKKNEEIFSV